MNATLALQRLRQVIRRQHKALSTESAYSYWLRRYIAALHRMPEGLSSEQRVERFLTRLACNQGVSASTQNQASPFTIAPRKASAPASGASSKGTAMFERTHHCPVCNHVGRPRLIPEAAS